MKAAPTKYGTVCSRSIFRSEFREIFFNGLVCCLCFGAFGAMATAGCKTKNGPASVSASSSSSSSKNPGNTETVSASSSASLASTSAPTVAATPRTAETTKAQTETTGNPSTAKEVVETTLAFFTEMAQIVTTNSNNCQAMGTSLQTFVTSRSSTIAHMKSIKGQAVEEQAKQLAATPEYQKKLQPVANDVATGVQKCQGNKKVIEALQQL